MNKNLIDTSSAYRADLDGLRAIAVLSVAIFHLHASWMPSGFLGVDIFFVLSGYLISTILFREISGGILFICKILSEAYPPYSARFLFGGDRLSAISFLPFCT